MFRRRRKQNTNQNQRLTSEEETTGGNYTYYTVRVPDGVSPNQTFRVFCGSSLTTVVVPETAVPGQTLQIKVLNNNSDIPLPPSPPPPVNPDIRTHQRNEYLQIIVPEGVRPGQQFAAIINGKSLMVTCPAHTRPGDHVRIILPERQQRVGVSPTQMYEVAVPNGLLPGQAMVVDVPALGERLMVTIPAGALPGQKIRFNVPKQNGKKTPIATQPQLVYSSDNRWKRIVRDDGRLVWTRDDSLYGDDVSSFVRVLDYPKASKRGLISFQPASDVTVDSSIKITHNRKLISHGDVLRIQRKSFKDKCSWFRDKCNDLRIEWSKGHIELNVRRDMLLMDSLHAVNGLTKDELKKIWRINFIGEPGIDAGGLYREWFEIASKNILDPDLGLWASTPNNPDQMEINPASDVFVENHLELYRFFGRILGKALFDGQLISGGRLSRYIIKHLLGWPISLSDLLELDSEYYNGLSQLIAMSKEGHDLSSLFINFTITQTAAGSSNTVELIEDGADLALTNDNIEKYLEESLKHRVFRRTKPQLNELLLGFVEVIPEPLLVVFDVDELSLLLCGSPCVDMDDWMRHTKYQGEYESRKQNHPVCRWFWEIISSFDDKAKRRLLHFATGSSGVPGRGFEFMQGSDGSIHKFTLASSNVNSYPVSHTCFNRLDIPLYASKDELYEKLLEAMENASVGFTMD